MKTKEGINLLIRYALLILIPLNSLYIIYLILTPLTVYPVFFLLKQTYGAQLLIGNQIFSSGQYIELVGACIAGSAYYLLLILNLSTPMAIKKRIKTLLFSLLFFLILNIIRIFVFSIILIKGYSYFDLAHIWAWYLGGTILVVLVWFLTSYIFKIKDIPVYTDIKKVAKDVLKRRRVK
jgi:exosortase/archaeosortase family protein